MRVGAVVNAGRPHAMEFARRLRTLAGRLGVDLVADAHDREAELDLAPWDEEDVDMVVAVGGDGTVLEAAKRALALDRPLLGFNLGTLGFLAEVDPQRLDEALTAVAAGRYQVRHRMTVEARLPSGISEMGVNDVVAEKIDSQRLVALAVEIDGDPFITYRADGLVMATPTGSTAYAFSAGGPLVDPALDALLVTPVAPHSLFDRTLVLDAATRVRCVVAADRPVRVTVDGREIGTLGVGEAVEVTRGPKRAAFVELQPHSFSSLVTRRLSLG